MDDETRKPDAADVAPRPDETGTKDPRARDARNDSVREDGARTIPTADLNSANDE